MTFYLLTDSIRGGDIIRAEGRKHYAYSFGVCRWVRTTVMLSYMNPESPLYGQYREVPEQEAQERVIQKSVLLAGLLRKAEELATRFHAGQTDKGVLAAGEARSVDECCLASKLYFGHAAQLVGACDALFVPAYANEGRLASFCTKFQSLPDLTACTLADEGVRTFGVFVDRVGEWSEIRLEDGNRGWIPTDRLEVI